MCNKCHKGGQDRGALKCPFYMVLTGHCGSGSAVGNPYHST